MVREFIPFHVQNKNDKCSAGYIGETDRLLDKRLAVMRQGGKMESEGREDLGECRVAGCWKA